MNIAQNISNYAKNILSTNPAQENKLAKKLEENLDTKIMLITHDTLGHTDDHSQSTSYDNISEKKSIFPRIRKINYSFDSYEVIEYVEGNSVFNLVFPIIHITEFKIGHKDSNVCETPLHPIKSYLVNTETGYRTVKEFLGNVEAKEVEFCFMEGNKRIDDIILKEIAKQKENNHYVPFIFTNLN